jgi:CDP-diglyceride synthetase
MQKYSLSVLGLLGLLAAAAPAHAYIGPGAGLSAIGSFLALCAAVVIGVFGFLWFPIKRLLKKKKRSQEES